MTTNLSVRPWRERKGFVAWATGSSLSSWAHGPTMLIFSGTASLASIRSRMNRSSTTTCRARWSAIRLMTSNRRVRSDVFERRPAETIWSGLMSITHQVSGAPRMSDTNVPPSPAKGGLVLTSTASTLRMRRLRKMACVMNRTCATRRTAIDDLPKLDSGSRRTSTPCSDSRR